MVSDHLIVKNNQAQTKLTTDPLTAPLARLIGGFDLWGRLDSFLILSEASGHSPNTIRAYRTKLGDFVRFVNSLGATMPGDVTEDHVIAYLAHKRKTCNGVSINAYYRHIRPWFNWMASPERRIIEKSPFAGIKTPPIPKTVIQPLTVEQIEQVLSCCNNYTRGLRDRAIIMLIYDSGLRCSEVSSIKLEDVDLKRGAIKVMGKGAKERFVAIGEEAKNSLMQYLYRRKDTAPWLFVTHFEDNPGRMLPYNIGLTIRRTMRRAGITGVKTGPHTLRHSFATASIRNGANLFYVQSLLGHSTLNMTRRYAAVIDSEEAVKQHHNFSPADRLNKKRSP